MLLNPTVTYGAILSAKKTFLNNPIKKIVRPKVKKLSALILFFIASICGKKFLAKTIGPAISWGKKLTKNKWSRKGNGFTILSRISNKRAICWKVKKDIASGIIKFKLIGKSKKEFIKKYLYLNQPINARLKKTPISKTYLNLFLYIEWANKKFINTDDNKSINHFGSFQA